MPRFAININAERHAFVNMLADKIITSQPDVSFCSFQVPHPLQDESLVVIESEDAQAASKCVADACMQLVSDIDRILADLGLPETCAHESHILLPDVSTSLLCE